MNQCFRTWAQLPTNNMLSAGLQDLQLGPGHALEMSRVFRGEQKGLSPSPSHKDFLDLGTLTQNHLFFSEEEFPNGFF